ncbi:MAG TPA: PEP-CTERM sorting domain-containing protein [Bryobacteraceae bacterium]|jgi:hypothetical protein
MKIVGVGLCGLVALLSSGTGLHAAIITETVSGTIQNGIDNAGVFGLPGANLAGSPASVTFTLDTSLLAADGLYTSLPGFTEQLFNDGAIGDGALTNSITVNGATYALTQSSGAQERFMTQVEGSGSLVTSVIAGLGTGNGSSITIHSSAAYQFPVLLGNPKPFLDLAAANATSVNVGIDLQGGAFETDLIIVVPGGGGEGGGGPVPEPSSVSMFLGAGLFTVFMSKSRKRSLK